MDIIKIDKHKLKDILIYCINNKIDIDNIIERIEFYANKSKNSEYYIIKNSITNKIEHIQPNNIYFDKTHLQEYCYYYLKKLSLIVLGISGNPIEGASMYLFEFNLNGIDIICLSYAKSFETARNNVESYCGIDLKDVNINIVTYTSNTFDEEYTY